MGLGSPSSGPPRGQRRERIIPSVLLKSGAWRADGTPGAGFFLRLSLVRTQDEASHLEVEMILKTGNSVYEVDTQAKRFRLVGKTDAKAPSITLGRWQHFDFMTPVEPGERVRFAWLAEKRDRAARIGFIDTSPLVAVTA